MPVADGLLARFRPEAGLSADQLTALADAAETHGNGLIEVTARGNLQVRGLSESSAAQFRAALADAGIVAQPAPAIEISPLAGEDPKAIADPRPLAEALRAVCDEALAQGPLSPKLSIVLVTGGQILLDGLKADIRLIARQKGWALELGSDTLGELDEADVPAAVAIILDALQAEGPRARASDLAAAPITAKIENLRPLAHSSVRPASYMVGPLSLSGHAPALRVGLPFGQVRARQVRDLAQIMSEQGVGEVRTAPDRSLVLIGFDASTLRDLAPALARVGYWTRPDATGVKLSICSGAEDTDAGVIQAAELAQGFYSGAPELIDGSFHIHVSTCAKGCPHAGRPGIVLDGSRLTLYRAPDAKPLATLDPAAIETGIVSLANRIRDTRQPGETTLSVLGRLGQQ
jgi:precorrin-3B synthase